MVRQKSLPYRPGQSAPYKISRSKIELFMQCPRCFWLDARLRIKRPDGPPFSLNKAVDGLLKKEFDSYRLSNQPHPIMVDNQIQAVPFMHAELDKWRSNFTGVSTLHQLTNLLVFGAVDDIWVSHSGELIVADYKATSKPSVVSIDADWQLSYKRQLEVYQWLLRQNGFKVSSTAYFIYTNGRLDLDGFNDRLEFVTKVIPYEGSDKWINPTLLDIKTCLENDQMPPVGKAAMGGDCDFCSYARARTDLTLKAIGAASQGKPKSTKRPEAPSLKL